MIFVDSRRRLQQREANRKWRAKNGTAYQRKWRAEHLEEARESARKSKNARRKRDKAALIAAYGGKCECCGESIPEFLTIDHIDGNGAAHRRQIRKSEKRRASVLMYEWLKRNGYPRDNFRLLCYNCNCGRQFNNGVCPHKRTEL